MIEKVGNFEAWQLAISTSQLVNHIDRSLYEACSWLGNSPHDYIDALHYKKELMDLMLDLKDLYQKTAGTQHLKNYLTENYVNMPISIDAILNHNAHLYGDLLPTFDIDVNKDRYGFFLREGAKKFEISKLVHTNITTEKLSLSGKITIGKKVKLMNAADEWADEFYQFYGEPFHINDNLASISPSLKHLTLLIGYRSRGYQPKPK